MIVHRKPSVCIAVSSLTMGGVQRVTSLIANELARINYPISLIRTCPRFTDFYTVTAPYDKTSHPIFYFLLRVLRKTGKLFHLKRLTHINPDTQILKKELTKLSPEIVVLDPDFLLSINDLKKSFPDIKFICWMHNTFDVYTEKYFKSSRNQLIDNISNADAVICLESDTAKKWHAYNANVTIIHNPVTIETNQEVSNLNSHIISFTSRIAIDHKGLKTLVKVAKELPGDWTIHFAGDGPDRNEFLNLINSAEVGKKLILHGALKDDELRKHYCNSSIFLCTSNWEGFPLVTIEAMSFGLPLMASDIPALREVTDNGKYGVLASPKDISSFVKTLLQLIESKQQREKFSRLSLRRVKDFDIKVILPKWVSLFENTVNHHME